MFYYKIVTVGDKLWKLYFLFSIITNSILFIATIYLFKERWKKWQKDFKRKKYHNSYCDGKWGDSRNYDVSINSSKLGTDDTLKILIDYIETRKCK